MPKKISKTDIPTILNAVSRFPSGATIEDITKILKTKLSRRTLQRRLSFLIKEGLLIAEGWSQTRKYKLPSKSKEVLQEEEDLIPLSAKGKEIQKLVERPIQSREPISYLGEFLESYIPNSTFYLDDSLRKELFEMGKPQNETAPAGTYARQIFNRLLIDLSWNSSRLEGNTYSLLETERLLKDLEPTEGKNPKETQMIINHKEAIEYLVESAEQITINRFTILNLHALLSNNLLSNPNACGKLRSIPVGIGESVYLPLAIPQLIEDYFNQVIDKGSKIKDPFEKSFFLMVHLPYLQPFEDVNKRVSRLAANIPLIQKNLSPISFVDVPKDLYINGLLGVYELNRIDLLKDVFVWAYKRSCARYAATRKTLGEPDLLRLRYRNPIKEVIKLIVSETMTKKIAHIFIEQKKEVIPSQDQEKFVEIIETELLALHEGNIARYRITQEEYEKWTATWKGKIDGKPG